VKPLIGLSVGEFYNLQEQWAGSSYGQRRDYVDAILQAGGIPLLLPIVDNVENLRPLYDICQGILFCGGNDIDPAQYGAELNAELTKDISPRRDEQELQLLKWALEDDKPALGICRGMQVMNVGGGGTMCQDVLALRPGSQNHRASSEKQDFAYLSHVLQLDPASKLAHVLDTHSIETNALHHQAVDKLGDNLVISARSEDGVVEGLEFTDKKFILGVQSHPEALTDVEPRWQRLFKAFVDAAIAHS
jgi:putative glutamine amidotransferase